MYIHGQKAGWRVWRHFVQENLFFCKVIIVLYVSEYGEVLACKYLSYFEAQ